MFFSLVRYKLVVTRIKWRDFKLTVFYFNFFHVRYVPTYLYEESSENLVGKCRSSYLKMNAPPIVGYSSHVEKKIKWRDVHY